MANSNDFRATQIQTNKLIVTGSNAGSAQCLLVYGHSAQGTPGEQGIINSTYFPTDSVGADAFVYFSGAIGSRGTDNPGAVVFAGDVHVSGNLSVDGTTPGGGESVWFSATTGSAYTTGSVEIQNTHGTGLSLVVSGSTVLGGLGAYATGSSVAQGESTTASGFCSHAQGQSSTASGDYGHAEGFNNTASGTYSHAEGSNTFALGEHSHAQGVETHAFGTGSLAAGLGTVASGAVDGNYPTTTTQAAFGKYNTQESLALFVVGDGIDANNRHDVFCVNSGSVEVTGSFISPQITGSLSGTVEGNPFLVAGSGITTSYNSLGQWEISGSAASSEKTIPILAGVSTTVLSASTAIGYVHVNPSNYVSGAMEGIGLSVSGVTGSLELYDLTDNAVSATLQWTETSPTHKSASFALPATTRIYELRSSKSGGGGADYALFSGVLLVMT